LTTGGAGETNPAPGHRRAGGAPSGAWSTAQALIFIAAVVAMVALLVLLA
jgi:hypothetical protein